MNREIKFRVWDVEAAKMLAWDDIWYSIVNVPSDWVGGGIPWVPFLTALCMKAPASKYMVEQFTGLLDKNGREIYEGDIVSVLVSERDHIFRFNAEVWWDDGAWCFGRLKNLEGREYGHRWHGTFHFMTSEETWIVGNIHENQELLKR